MVEHYYLTHEAELIRYFETRHALAEALRHHPKKYDRASATLLHCPYDNSYQHAYYRLDDSQDP